MSKTEPEAHLTPQQKTVIELTVSAVTEMLNNIMSITPKKRAIILRKPHRQSTKSTVWPAMLFSIVDGNQELPARRESIRKRLPGGLAEIDKSDASDILQSLVRLYFLEHKKKIVRARGGPSPYGYKDDKDDNRRGYCLFDSGDFTAYRKTAIGSLAIGVDNIFHYYYKAGLNKGTRLTRARRDLNPRPDA